MIAAGAQMYATAQEGGKREVKNRSLLVQEKYRVVVAESDN
jgi:hypothetical protein